MIQQNQSLITEAAQLTPANNLVESTPVEVSKKLSAMRTQVVGDFSLIPATAMDLVGLIGSLQLDGMRIPIATKSARKGWSVTAKW